MRVQCDRPVHAIDVDIFIIPEDRERFAFALADVHGVQQLHVASIPREAGPELHQLHMDDCQVVYECSQNQPRP
jgi:hypothetical protein